MGTRASWFCGSLSTFFFWPAQQKNKAPNISFDATAVIANRTQQQQRQQPQQDFP